MKARVLVPVACAFLAIAVGGGGYLMLVKKERERAHALVGQIADANSQLASLRESAHGTPVVGASEVFQLAQAMPTNDDVAGILLDLSRLAKASKLKLVAVRPSPRVTLTDGASAVPLSITLDGTWSGLSSFLRATRGQVAVHGAGLTVTGRLFDVDSVTVTSATQTSQTEIEATLTLNAFDYGAAPSPSATAGTTAGNTTTTTTPTTTASAG